MRESKKPKQVLIAEINTFFGNINHLACTFILFMALIAMWPAGQVRAAESESTGYKKRLERLSFEKEEYLAGETITVLYPDTIDPKTIEEENPEFLYNVIVNDYRSGNFSGSSVPSDEKERQKFSELSKGNRRFRDKVSGKERVGGILQYHPKLDNGAAYRDISFQLEHKESGPIGKIYYIRVRPFVGTVPSALNFTAGEACGGPVTIFVTPPGISEFTLLKTAKTTRWSLSLYQLGSPFLGGRQVPDRRLEDWDLKSGVSKKIVWENYKGLILPTRYELRLEVYIESDDWGGDYVIARKKFTQKPKAISQSFAIEEPSAPTATEKFSFRYFGKNQGWLGVELFRLDAGGRLRNAQQRRPFNKTGKTLPFRALDGTYIARLRNGVDWNVTLDNLRVDIRPNRDPSHPQLLNMNGQLTFFEGDDIPVYVHAKDIFENLKTLVGGVNTDRIDDLSVGLYPEKPSTATKEVNTPAPSDMVSVNSILGDIQKVQQRLAEATAKGDKIAAEKYGKEMTELYKKMGGSSLTLPQKPATEPLRSWAVELGKDETLLRRETNIV